MLNPRRFVLIVSTFVCAAVQVGCSSEPMTEREKAARITELRKQASESLARYDQTHDFERLREHVDLLKEATQVMPDFCGKCYADYGVALSRLGFYYDTLVQAFKNELAKAPAPEKPELEAKIAKYDSDATSAYRESNIQFDLYFRSGETIDPLAYSWVFQQYERLGEFGQAINYLDLFLANANLRPEARSELLKRKKQLEKDSERRREEDLRRELNLEEPATANRGTKGRPEPAN